MSAKQFMVCVYIHIHVWVYIYIYIYIYTHTCMLSGKASALDMPRTWVRLLASVKFFIYSVASILQCSPCEVLEGPISTRVGII